MGNEAHTTMRAATVVLPFLLLSLRGVQSEEADLIELTKYFLQHDGWWGPKDESLVADDFVFRGPVIGPYNASDSQHAFSPLTGPYNGFLDLTPGFRSCWTDPELPLQVSCVLYPRGTHTKDWHSPFGLLNATGNKLIGGGEVWSVLWTKDRTVRMKTAGYPISAVRGNACGFGAAFAVLCAVQGGTNAAYQA